MKRFAKALICVLLCFAMTLVIVPEFAKENTVEAATQADVNNLQNQKKTQQNKLADLKKELTSLKSNRASQIEQKINLENQLVCLEEEINTTENIIEAYRSMYDVKNTRKTSLELQTETNYQNFRAAFRYNYMYGQYTDFELLFSVEKLFDYLSDDEYSERIFNYDKVIINELDENAKELSDITEEINELIAEETAYKEELDTMKNEVEQTQNEVNTIISEIDAKIKTSEALIVEANNKIAAMDSQIKQFLAEIAAKSKGNYVGGKMTFPIPISSYSRVSSYYGYRTHPVTGKKNSFHTGIDLPAAKNTKIYAANSGTVILAKYYGGYGNCVMLDHGGGIVTVYGHCNSLAVKVGQTVSAGDVIAYVGTTGSSTGNHLHFEVRVNGSTVDPIKNGYIVLP